MELAHGGSNELWAGSLAWITPTGLFKVGEVRFSLISIDSLYYSVVLNAAQLYFIVYCLLGNAILNDGVESL